MRVSSSVLLVVIVLLVISGALALVRLQAPASEPRNQAWSKMPDHPAHVDHASFFTEPFADGPSVTQACLKCHDDAAHDFMQTAHWSWAGDRTDAHAGGGSIAIGKKNLINNFCVSVESNWPACTTCHAGYGWENADFDFTDASRVDCLVCHDATGTYRKRKGGAGHPAEDVDLLAVARSVAAPSRTNCGQCHFNGGGGDAVKHGDLDQTMFFPPEDIDVHMGRYDFACIDCHRTTGHVISGRSMSVSDDGTQRVRCTDCHSQAPHANARLDSHVETVACQSCHIPKMAVREPTKMYWDWSTAGEDRPEQDPHVYLKIKGSFRYAREVTPEYAWYNEHARHYLKGDVLDPEQVTVLNVPLGDIGDRSAKIWPFKIHRGKQIYDRVNHTLLIPKTFGPGGYWTEFDWDKALRLGSEVSGLDYSGEYGFTETAMYWPLSHMVAPKDRALQCNDCHGDDGRMDWAQLGYEGDPAERGGRRQSGELRTESEGTR